MFQAMKAVLLSLALSAGLSAGLVLPVAAYSGTPPATTRTEPAIWTLTKTNGKTITFFGSVHLLPQAQNWQTDALKAAFAGADVVVFETPIGDANSPELQSLVMQNATNPPGVTLSTLLKPEEKADVEKAATLVGAPFSMLESFRPWMAAVQLTLAFAIKEGMDPTAGVDKVLEAQAKEAGKALDYFETAREQIEIFTTLDQAQEIAFLVIGARDMVAKPHQLKELLDAWGKGDVAAIDTMMNEGMETMPDLARRLLDDRNARWADKISGQYMGDDKNYLIVVGAAHLAGAKSVVTMLRAKGAHVVGP